LTALLLTLALVFATMMLPRLTGFARLIKLALPLLITVQIGLGLESVRSFLGLVQVTTHLGVGALLWALLVVELWLLRPLAQSSEVSANIPTSLVSQPGGVA
jgi:heme A synthase